MSDRLRAGLVGLGMMGRNHARVLSSLQGVDLVVVADPQVKDRAAIGEAAGVEGIDELLAVGVDYCVVAAPTFLHESIGSQLAAAGVHALIEKPLAHDIAAAQVLLEAFERRNLVAAVGHIERYNPALRTLRQRLAQGELGDVFQVTSRRQGPFPERIADVGVVKDLASHDIDLTMWVTQQVYESVAAQTAHRSGRPHEDLVAVLGLLTDGTVTSHLINWLSPMKERVVTVTGERGSFVADLLTADLTFHANGIIPTEWDAIAKFRGVSEGDVVRYAIAKPEPLRAEHEAFRDAVLGDGHDIVTLREGVETVKVAEAILASAATGQTQELRKPLPDRVR